MSEHTATPWQATYNSFDEFWELDPGENYPAFGCFIGWCTEHKDNQDNVDFMIRAVNCHDDLLAACKEALKEIESFRDYWTGPSMQLHYGVGPRETQLRAAIARAEGNPVTR